MSDICAQPGLSADSIRKIPAQLTQFVELFYQMPGVNKYVEKFPCFELPPHGDLVQLASNVPSLVLVDVVVVVNDMRSGQRFIYHVARGEAAESCRLTP